MWKRSPGSCLIAALALWGSPSRAPGQEQPGAAPARVRIPLNDGWLFRLGDGATSAPANDDAGWNPAALPHTWNGADLHDDAPGYVRGVGWYQRELRIDPAWRDRCVYLHFEGANQVAEVRVDGATVGRHVGGYTAFTCEITSAIRAASGPSATVLVRVDNRHDPDIPPLSADFNFCGGIYRDVWLITTGPVHFDLLDHGGPGVYVDARDVSEASARLRVRGTVVAASRTSSAVEVAASVADQGGREVLRATAPVTLDPRGRGTFELTGMLPGPQLWSPDDPHLYNVRCAVSDGRQSTDRVDVPLGVRWFEFDAARGFALNGRPLQLRGTNRHQDHAKYGVAVPNEAHVGDLELIKAMGANFLRLAHYPQDSAVLDAADRLGLVIWEEIPIVNHVTRSDAFREHARGMLVEMIRQHYNHPSVAMWGYMNEIFLFGPDGTRSHGVDDKAYVEWVVGLARELDSLSRAEDATRVTVMAAHGDEIYNDTGIADVPQVLGWNLYQGWYADKIDDFGKFLARQHERHPERPLIVSEYGAGSDQRIHSLAPECFDQSIEYQQRLHAGYLDQIPPFLCGTAVWNQFDFAAEPRGDSMPHINQKGLCTYDRRPKDVYYLYQARWADRPVLHIAARDWPDRAVFIDAQPAAPEAAVATHPVLVYTNCADVELWCNGQSLGRRTVGGKGRVAWDVPLRAAGNELMARGAHAESPCEDRCQVQVLPVYWRPFSELNVNVGSQAEYRDADGRHWLPDREYTPGGWGWVGGERAASGPRPNIGDTDDDALYHSHRRGMSAYRFDVPDGEYQVELLAADWESTKSGERIFDVAINGRVVLPGLDLAVEPGRARALRRTFVAQAASGSGIHIAFTARSGVPVLSAISIRRTLPTIAGAGAASR